MGVLTLCAVATRTLLSVASVLLRLTTVSCLRAVLALALAMLLSSTVLTGRTAVLLLAAVTAVLLCRRGRSVPVLTLRAAAMLATGLVRCWRCTASVCSAGGGA